MDVRPVDHDQPGITHDPPCQWCGHAAHHWTACDLCACPARPTPGIT